VHGFAIEIRSIVALMDSGYAFILLSIENRET
jgi:hypothetical protein